MKEFNALLKSVRFDVSREANILLLLLILTDIVFIVLNVIYYFSTRFPISVPASPEETSLVVQTVSFLAVFFSNESFSIAYDLGFAESFQYIKEFWIVCLLLNISKRDKSFLLLLWAILFTFLVLDDSIGLHEISGLYLSQIFAIEPMFGVRSRDIGELLFAAAVGLFFFFPLVTSYLKGDEFAKRVSRFLGVLLFALVLFGVGVDVIHQMAEGRLAQLLGLIEDFGEMIVMSLIVWTAFSFYFSKELESKVFIRHTVEPDRKD